MKEIIKRARKGDEEWLEEHYPAEYYHHLATFRSHKKPKVEVMNYEKTPHEWWVGETGTGKSKLLWELYPNHFRKDQNKWWCGYRGQEVVAIEEASPKTMEHLASRLKQWADRSVRRRDQRWQNRGNPTGQSDCAIELHHRTMLPQP